MLKLRGSAIAAVHENQMCSVCRVILRPQVYQDVMKGEAIIACDSCQRILYFVPPAPAEEAKKPAESASEEPVQDEAAAQ